MIFLGGGKSGVLVRKSGGLLALPVKQPCGYHFVEHRRKVSRDTNRHSRKTSEVPAVEQAQLNPYINYGGLDGRH